MSALKDRVEAFLFHEADIADRHAYAEWLTLWSKDAKYWLPCNDDDSDPETHVALIYETYSGLENRVQRLMSGYAHTQSPPTRTCRVVANVQVRELDGGDVEAKSVMNITAFRRNRMDTLAGRVVHQLRPQGNEFKIVQKTVYLVNNDGYMSNMTYLI